MNGENKALSNALAVNPNGFYSITTKLHEKTDLGFRPTVATIRDLYESREITTLQWISCEQNIAEASNNRNVGMLRKLSTVLSSGTLPDDILSTAKRMTFTGQTLKHEDENETNKREVLEHFSELQ